jgi:hypothetical protein
LICTHESRVYLDRKLMLKLLICFSVIVIFPSLVDGHQWLNTCNPSYSRGRRDQENLGWNLATANSSWENPSQKTVNGLIQGVGPVFKHSTTKMGGEYSLIYIERESIP